MKLEANEVVYTWSFLGKKAREKWWNHITMSKKVTYGFSTSKQKIDRWNLAISRPFSTIKQVPVQSEKHNKIRSRKKRRGKKEGGKGVGEGQHRKWQWQQSGHTEPKQTFVEKPWAPPLHVPSKNVLEYMYRNARVSIACSISYNCK